MTDNQLQSRQATINDLATFIESSQSQLDRFLGQLQWNREEVLSEKKMKVCPVNSHHVVLETSLQRHTEACQLAARGYTRQEQKDIQNTQFYYSKSTSVVSVVIDQETQKHILSRVPGSTEEKEVPLTADRMDKTLTSAEKLAIYETVLEKSKAANRQSAISVQDLELDPDALLKKDEGRGKKSRMEVLAELRDYKRRRQSYRAKNVHITKRSQTEIMRDVIEMQMSEIQQALQGDEDDKGSDQTSRQQGDRSPDQTQSRSRDISRSPVHSRSRGSNRQTDERRGSPERNRPRRANLEEDTNYHRSRRSPGSSRSSRHEDRNYHRTNQRDHSPRGEVQENPGIKIEKDLPGYRETSRSSDRPRSRRNDDRERPLASQQFPEVRIKVEKDAEPPSGESSRSSSLSRKEDGERRHKHSKHKHHRKHKHHSRDR